MIDFDKLKERLEDFAELDENGCRLLQNEVIAFMKSGTEEQKQWLLHCGYCEGLSMRYAALRDIRELNEKHKKEEDKNV